MVLIQDFLAEQGVHLTMSEIPGRRTDQLGDFMTGLEIAAVGC